MEYFPNSSHFEYLIDGVNLKEIIDLQYGYNGFVEQNGFVGWISESIDINDLELSIQILKGEKISTLSLTDSQRLNYTFESQIPIYTCPCGDINCSGLMVDIIVSENKITWTFDDKNMSPIVFDLKQYREEIDLKMKKFKKISIVKP